MIAKGERKANLYVIHSSSSFSSFWVRHNVCQPSYLVSNNVTSQIWHQRLGHLSFQKLSLLKNQLQIECIDHEDDTLAPYSVCPSAKQRRPRWYQIIICQIMPLIHCNIWGPYHTPTNAGYKFFLTMVETLQDLLGSIWWNRNMMQSSLFPSLVLLLKLNFTR